eukprot:1114795-Pelagomonas_calceolata.AAC.3
MKDILRTSWSKVAWLELCCSEEFLHLYYLLYCGAIMMPGVRGQAAGVASSLIRNTRVKEVWKYQSLAQSLSTVMCTKECNTFTMSYNEL